VSILDKLRPPLTFAKSTPDSGEETAADAPVVQAERRRNSRRNARPGTRALIADDSPTVVSALKKILQSAGFVTMEAANSNMALSLARGGIPDIIFLDIVLPGDNGFSVLRSLRKDPSTAHIPVIMMSGNERATELFFGRRTGADDFMKKPFSRHEVFARIERLLDDELVPRRVSPLAAPVAAETDLRAELKSEP
jgi:twitching motility two-component system response regulator PilH